MNAPLSILNRLLPRLANARTAALVFLLASCGHLAACGYHVAGRTDALPKSIHVIAIPALENNTNSYRIEQRLTFSSTPTNSFSATNTKSPPT
jgi:outer membrane lipopolysaccharide assembly protein LptE/RlpB